MRQILVAQGKDLTQARAILEREYHGDPWIVLENPNLALWEFLRELHDTAGMSNAVLSRLKACKSFPFVPGAIQIVQEDGASEHPANFIELLKSLRLNSEQSLKFVCANRKLRATLMQQLLYLGLPLDRYLFDLAGDDCGSPACTLLRMCAQSRTLLQNEPCNKKWRKMLLSMLVRLESELKSSRLKLALAASKKSGKSTLLNCLLGEHIAPTGNELASPNSISYRKNGYGKYRLAQGRRISSEAGAQELQRSLQARFTEAQYDVARGFCLENMEIEYAGKRSLLPAWTLIDTPGADASGARHGEATLRSLEECDAALFLIDYQKYLTDSEKNLLVEAKNRLSADNLYLALNKLDMALQDSGAKSWIASVDFIRSRLIAIDERFAEHFIQPLSARLYSNLLLLRNATTEFEALRKLFDDRLDVLELLPEMRRELKGRLPGEINTALANLSADAVRMADAYDFETLTASQLEAFSGVPMLARYLLRSRITNEIEISWEARQILDQLRGLYCSPALPTAFRRCLEPFA